MKSFLIKAYAYAASHRFLFMIIMFTALLDIMQSAQQHFKDGNWLWATAVSVLAAFVAYYWVTKWSRQIK